MLIQKVKAVEYFKGEWILFFWVKQLIEYIKHQTKQILNAHVSNSENLKLNDIMFPLLRSKLFKTFAIQSTTMHFNCRFIKPKEFFSNRKADFSFFIQKRHFSSISCKWMFAFSFVIRYSSLHIMFSLVSYIDSALVCSFVASFVLTRISIAVHSTLFWC